MGAKSSKSEGTMAPTKPILTKPPLTCTTQNNVIKAQPNNKKKMTTEMVVSFDFLQVQPWPLACKR